MNALLVPPGTGIVESATLRQPIAGVALVLGAVLVIVGLTRLVMHERGQRSGSTRAASGVDSPRSAGADGNPHLGLILLLLILVVGAWLRLSGLEAKTLTHTEAILPNLAWPPDTWPPPRHSFYETFWWQYHSEPHPPAHYLLVWAWTKAFGTSLASLRMPSVLFGVGSIVVVHFLGSLAFNRRVGLLAAAFVAFNGFHIYFSQYARVFMMGTFLALLSTLALLKVLHATGARRRWEACYVMVSALAIYTQTFYWLVLATQMVWVALQLGGRARVSERVMALQALVIMLGAPAIAHLIYRGGAVALPGPSFTFVADYLSFGFVLLLDHMSIPQRGLPQPLFWALAAFALLLIVIGSIARAGDPLPRTAEADKPDARALPGRPLVTVAAGAALITLALVIVALRRQSVMSFTIVVPLLALTVTPAYRFVRSMLENRRPEWSRRTFAHWLATPRSLVVFTAFLPFLFLVGVSFRSSLLINRGFLIFIPYVLVLAAAGALVLGRHRLLLLPVAAALLSIHVASIVHWRQYPNEARDYAALATLMNERIQPGDLVFVRPESFEVTPMFYHLEDRGHHYVTRDYDRAVASATDARVWLMFFESYTWGPFSTTTDEMSSALTGFRLHEEVEALRARAQLFVRND